MKNEKLPIKFFAPREIDELRVDAGGNSDPPKWILSGEALEQRAKKLSNEFDGFESQLLEREAKASPIPFIFLAKMSHGSTSKSRRKEITNLFQVNNVLVFAFLAVTSWLMMSLYFISENRPVSSL